MITLSDWVKSQSKFHGICDARSEIHEVSDPNSVARVEFANLVEDVLDNLMTSQVAGLRSSVQDAGQTWSKQLVTSHSSRLSAELDRVECRIMDAVTETLLPILADVKRRELMNEFSLTLKKLLPELAASEITVMSPENMIERLQTSLSQNGIEARILKSEGDELSVTSGNVLISAELRNWSMMLNEAVQT